MGNSLDDFIRKIPDFFDLPVGDMIPYFVYYLCDGNNLSATPKMIRECYGQLELKAYSNISAYLNKKSVGKNAIFLKGNSGYTLTRKKKEMISSVVLDDTPILPTNALLDLSILEGTPFYIKKIAEQMCCCYDANLYDACLVMMRKLFETLIIECFERHGNAQDIMDSNGNFKYLSDLIPLFLLSTHWSASRNLEKNIKAIKKYGDLSAHNRRFFAKRKDIDDFKFEMRQCLQEIILIIDYTNWDRCNPVSNTGLNLAG